MLTERLVYHCALTVGGVTVSFNACWNTSSAALSAFYSSSWSAFRSILSIGSILLLFQTGRPTLELAHGNLFRSQFPWNIYSSQRKFGGWEQLSWPYRACPIFSWNSRQRRRSRYLIPAITLELLQWRLVSPSKWHNCALQWITGDETRALHVLIEFLQHEKHIILPFKVFQDPKSVPFVSNRHSLSRTKDVEVHSFKRLNDHLWNSAYRWTMRIGYQSGWIL